MSLVRKGGLMARLLSQTILRGGPLVAEVRGGVVIPPSLVPSTRTAPGLSLYTANLAYPPEFDIDLDETYAVGDTLTLQWRSKAGAIIGSVSNVIDAGEATAHAAVFAGMASILSGTHRFVAFGQAPGELPSPNSVTIIQGPDDIEPVLSLPTSSSTGSTTATIGVTTDTAEGNIFYLVNQSASAPTVAAVKAGTSVAVSSSGAKTMNLIGLTAGTTYYAWFVHADAVGNDSAVLGTASFTTDANFAPIYHAAHAFDTINDGYANSTVTFTGGAIGAAFANRVVIAGITSYDGGTNAPTAVTIGGVAATRVGTQQGHMSMWRANVPTGTTANVAVTAPGTFGWVGCTLVAIRTSTPVPASVVTDAWPGDGTNPTATPTIPTDGLAIAFAAKDSTGVTPSWTNATARAFKANMVWSLGMATRSIAGNTAITAGGWGGISNGLIIGVWA